MTEERKGPGGRARRKEGSPAAAARIQQQETWVDLQLRQAMARGDFDDLPGFGKPLEDLTGQHDPDWWIKKLVERERITGVLPPSLQLRKEDAALDASLDELSSEAQVRRAVEEFNERVRWALYRPPEGPPMVTRARDVEEEVDRWRERREARREERRRTQREASRNAADEAECRRGWSWRLRLRRRP